MADESKSEINSLLFTQLVMSFQAAAWQQLGKITNPFTKKIERNLEMAKNSIDILGMLEEKTRGNLSEDEQKFLQHTLTQLRMNYVEESNKPESETAKDSEKKADENNEGGN
jgi:hypothetical protein